MYKRRVRILFWHPTDPAKARYATTLAESLGADWLEARSEETDHDWPDLLIALDCHTAPPFSAPHIPSANAGPWWPRTSGRTPCTNASSA